MNKDEKSQLYRPNTYNTDKVVGYKYTKPPKVSGDLYKPKQYQRSPYNPHDVRPLGKLHEYDHLYTIDNVKPRPKPEPKPEPPKERTPSPEPEKEKTPTPPVRMGACWLF